MFAFGGKNHYFQMIQLIVFMYSKYGKKKMIYLRMYKGGNMGGRDGGRDGERESTYAIKMRLRALDSRLRGYIPTDTTIRQLDLFLKKKRA